MISYAQNAFILKQAADGVSVADICRKARISQAIVAFGPSMTSWQPVARSA